MKKIILIFLVGFLVGIGIVVVNDWINNEATQMIFSLMPTSNNIQLSDNRSEPEKWFNKWFHRVDTYNYNPSTPNTYNKNNGDNDIISSKAKKAFNDYIAWRKEFYIFPNHTTAREMDDIMGLPYHGPPPPQPVYGYNRNIYGNYDDLCYSDTLY